MKPLRTILLLTALLISSHAALSQPEIRAAAEPDYPPLSLINERGEADGFSVELLRTALRVMGREVRFETGEWTDLRQRLENGVIDVLPLVGRTPEREDLYDFTSPYLTLHGSLFIREDHPEVKTLSDLPGKTIAVLRGDNAEEDVLRERLSEKIVSVSSFEEAFRMLSRGDADAVIAQKLMGLHLLQQLQIRNVKPSGPPIAAFKQDFCFAVKKGDSRLLALLNEGLALLKESGEYRRIYNEYLGAFDSSYQWIRFRETLLWAAVVILLLATAFGLVIYALNRRIHRDAAELHDANTALRESRIAALNMMEDALLAKEKLEITQYALDHAADAAFWVRPDSSFAYVNDAACRTLGYSQEELLSMSVSDIDSNYSPDRWALHWEEMKTIQGDVFQTRHQRKDGSLFPVEVHTNYLDFGKKEYLCASAHDITDRKTREAELKRLSAAIEQAVEVVVITDPEGTIVYVNPAFEKVTGYSQTEAVGQNPRLLKSGEQGLSFYSALWTAITSGTVWAGRFTNRRKNGTLYTEDATISPVRDALGAITGYVAVKRDITEELAREEQFRQNQKIQAIGQLAGGIAHDFNNILQAILGFSEILLMRLPPETPDHRNATEIRKAAGRAADLTHQLLAFSRKQPVNLKKMDLKTPVQDAEVLLKLLCGEPIKISIELPEEPCEVIADHSQMTQIIMNLAVNARDAMPEGGCLTISMERVHVQEHDRAALPDAEPGEFICLSITDTGFGMSQEVKDHLFEPFFTTKEVGKGTGLGLSVVYGIIKQNRGWTHVYSEEGHGTCFKVYLPASSDSSPAAGPAADGQPPNEARILLVEDDEEMRNLVLRILESSGYEVVTAGSAEEAFLLFDQETPPFDLLFSDMILPGPSGLELADRIRSFTPSLPVLLYSGYRDQRERWQNLESKGYHFLQKPFSLSSLLAAVHDALTKPV